MTTNGHWIAAAGPATGLMEAMAAAIGSGMVIGSFFAGLVGASIMSWRRAELDHRVLMYGYVGGFVALLALANDWIWG